MSAISCCNFKNILILTVVLFIYSAYSVDEYPTVSPDYFKENGGCAGLKASMCPDESELNCTKPIFDACGICRTCPKMEGEVCGGSYYKYGICAPGSKYTRTLYCNQNGTLVQKDVIMTGTDVIGVCKPRSCHKDCSKTPTGWVCGSDGIWRKNMCFLNKAANCFNSDIKITRNRISQKECGKILIEPEPKEIIVNTTPTTQSTSKYSSVNTVAETQQTPTVATTPTLGESR